MQYLDKCPRPDFNNGPGDNLNSGCILPRRLFESNSIYGLSPGPGGVPLSVERPCLHGAMFHCHTQNKLTIRSKNGEAIIQCG